MIRVYLQLNGVVGGVALHKIDVRWTRGCCQLFLVFGEPLAIVC